MRLSLLQGESVEEPAQFPTGDLAGAGAVVRRPAESASLQAAVEEPEAVVLPEQYLQLVALAIAEYEQG